MDQKQRDLLDYAEKVCADHSTSPVTYSPQPLPDGGVRIASDGGGHGGVVDAHTKGEVDAAVDSLVEINRIATGAPPLD